MVKDEETEGIMPEDSGARAASEAHFRLLVDSVRDYAIFLLDANGRVATWNDGARRIKRYASRDIIGKPYSIFFTDPDRADGRPQRLLAAAARDGAVSDEGWRMRGDGTRLWVSAVLTALFDPSGKLIGYGKVTRDETERHAAQEALMRSEERFRLLVGGLGEHALYMLDPSGVVVSWNQGAEKIKGYRAEEIIGQHFACFFTPDDRAADKPRRELELAERLGSYQEEGWRMRKDGTRFWAQVVVTALHGPDGKLRGFGKVTRDDTRRHDASLELQRMYERAVTAEAESRRHVAELEQRVAERTRLLSEQAKSLVKSNEELEKFAYVAAHDLQEPLRMIVNYVTLLERRHAPLFDEQARGFMAEVTGSALRMRDMIAGILDFSRPDPAGEKLEVCDLSRCAAEAIARLKEPIRAAGADVTVDPLPRVRGSGTQIVRVFQNLIGNALKFRRDAAPVVRIDAVPADGGWTIRVADNGIGIAAEHQERIFGIFERLHHHSKYPGSGIGLATCRKIVESHGGRLWVESDPGRGSTFCFTLSRL